MKRFPDKGQGAEHTGRPGAPKSVIFRVDASLQMGVGHVYRCLALADELRRRGAACTFVCRMHQGELISLVRERGHHAIAMPPAAPQGATTGDGPAHSDWLATHWATDARDTLAALRGRRADWLVVDHYALDKRWEQAVRCACDHLMVIDDLADRSHHCDMLLDPILGRAPSHYAGLVPPICRTLLGPTFALLRPEFPSVRPRSLARRKSAVGLRRLLVNMGGFDPGNATGEILQALRSCPLPADCSITVVMGHHAPWLEHVGNAAALLPWPTEVVVNSRNMAFLMCESDLAISSASSAAWERCAVGLPSLIAVLATNQQEAGAALEAAGAARQVKLGAALSADLGAWIGRFVSDPRVLADMSARAQEICDGLGTARACDAMQMALR